jgi:hypothetical protein
MGNGLRGCFGLTLVGMVAFVGNAGAAENRSARYNEVYRAATHNSYWVNRSNIGEAYASGVQERLLDQLLFDHVRALEIDIHKDDSSAGDWRVYHTDRESNSLCTPLKECLKQLQLFHYANPSHEVVTVVLELKELIGFNFDDSHTPADLDRLLDATLGSLLYRPRDFLARCPIGATMKECARSAGWPTIQELRGRFIFTVLGNWRHCVAGLPVGHGPSGWATYATWTGDRGSGVRDRSAFPMQTDFSRFLGDDCSSELIPPGQVRAAEDASVFRQVEAVEDPANMRTVERFLADGGIVRGRDSWKLADQAARVAAGFQMLQTDYPWIQLGDRGPAQPFRPLHPEEFADPAQFLEPGSRLAFAQSPSGGTEASFAFLVESRKSWSWQALPSSTRPSPDARFPNSSWTRGKGCLRAASDSESFSICRQTLDGQWYSSKPLGEDIAITIEIRREGVSSVQQFYSDANTSQSAGDLIRVAGYQDEQGKTCVTGYTSSEIASNGQPIWRELATQCFGEELRYQGLAAQWGDVLFVGTQHDGGLVSGRELAGTALLRDLSVP